MTITVVKLGGSLLTSPALPAWLDAISSCAREQHIIVVPGGGIYADQVREQQQQQGLTDLTAHRQAILAMCQTACCFMEKCPALVPVNDSGKVATLPEQGLPLLWLPLELLQDDSIPPSWDYTSDSLALWLAGRLQAPSLLLVKKRRLAPGSYLVDYINKEVIDSGFHILINNIKSKIYIFSEDQSPLLNQPQDWPQCLVPAADR